MVVSLIIFLPYLQVVPDPWETDPGYEEDTDYPEESGYGTKLNRR